ncbi:hypothetical protein TPHA_0C03140 [Tetrapisispora phaffii CBS 4417]|uniref:tRNA (adenine(58)-N(1))-methyltransferase non-catalytic subunit TRM6 n=1 Tax=Tetrapisispora phaffii (strain ATCC 24235 / CBS 4417 / NBRC 1672 / NRRL Y-8282 / UCD 70-5) TaxID=1071381 RepID=G8BRU1_TETPH|nr:hypothetical protein TPHA_0C03140 [Tetrapisispora phaffii CBS 4417]CCE62467.1 hypothetical protein TPHA_0C03140 [Tetrapisispora phaffii CBS 4417]
MTSQLDPLKQIAFNQFVILKLPSNNWKIVELRKNGSISLGKFGAFQVNDVIGYPLGTTFEIYYDNTSDITENEDDSQNKNKNKNKNNKIPVGKVRIMEEKLSESSNNNLDEGEELKNDIPELTNINSSENNKHLINIGNKVQKLTMAEIENLKNKSVSGDEIIAKIIDSHESFHKKTIQSQEKYLKRKQQKFAKYFTVNYLSGSALLEYFLAKGDQQRVMDMSQESVGMLLNLANIRSNGTYLCVDETGGLLVYFLLERMFGGDTDSKLDGKVVVIHENEHPNLDLLKYSNYSEEFINDHVKTISILDYFEPPTVAEVNSTFTPFSKEEIKELKGNKRNAYFRRSKLYKSQLDVVKFATEVKYDALVVTSTLSLPSLIPRLAENVHGSRPIVCFSQFKETLLELSHTLYDDLKFLAPSIYETRCRPYQTIRGKLHPLMTMRGGGGYLLCCHRVIPAPEPEQLVATDNKDPDVKKQKTE